MSDPVVAGTTSAAGDSEVGLVRAALATPVGRIVVLAGPDSVRRVSWSTAEFAAQEPGPVLDAALHQLREYFAGSRRDFDVPVDLGALEPATRRVLLALQGIPYGHAVTYGELATLSGTGLPPRAIGSVMGANPVPILIGCHRVLAGDGLGGYSGGPPGQGLETKRWLLEHEEILPPRLW
ncbi:MAG TPA: methylated-DNA--[protein]-cysteine S-methyltransferase [Microlunatus sp.]